jgi:polyisoprenoid-binding protein YceI
MSISFARGALAVAAVLGIALAAQAQVSSDPKAAPAGRYKVSPGHTQVVFSIMHMGLSPYYGRFGTVSGSLDFDPQAPERSSVDVAIQMNSANTPSDKLTSELCAASAFNCAQFPAATFKSTSLRRTGGNTGEITGNLTLAGVTKPVTLRVTFHGGMKRGDTGAYMLGFSATASVKRSDFGLTKMPWTAFVADDVTLLIEAEFAEDN